MAIRVIRKIQPFLNPPFSSGNAFGAYLKNIKRKKEVSREVVFS